MQTPAFYIWQHPHWPHMVWQSDVFAQALAETNTLRGKLLGSLSLFGINEQHLSMLDSLTTEIVHSAQIEGEHLNRDSVRSSVARHLGLEFEGLPVADHFTDGVVQILMDATQNHETELTAERLFNWHAALFPTGRSGIYPIKVGTWRSGEGAMQVVSGALGKQKVHYEAPDNKDVPQMMADFLVWANASQNDIDPLVKAAVAHLWFVTIHPFDDGNGRLCRTITEMFFSRADHTSHRYYSLSTELLNNRKDYYAQLEKAQKGGLDVTEWIEWFLNALRKAINDALDKAAHVIDKTSFWNKHTDIPMNERQRKVVNMLLDGFEGKLNSSKWYKINHCSQDTANRDINDLIAKGILKKSTEGGRNTSYMLVDWNETD